jgi:hypothetical protein
MKKSFLLATFLMLFTFLAQGQFGIGLTTGGDLYQRYTNPENPADSGALRSSGNAILNSSLGPKIWIGGNKFSLSIEAQVILGATGFDMNEYKGMGMLGLPIMAHLNFKGNSGFGNKTKFGTGFSVGGGIQYNKTEIYGTTKDYLNLERKLFPTYVGELQFGGGGGGINVYFYTRYGVGYDFDTSELTGANSLNIGIASSFNLTAFKKGKKSPTTDGDDDDAVDDAPVDEGQIRQ